MSIATAKEAWMEDLCSMEHGGGCWNSTFSRSSIDWEMEGVECFLRGLEIREL